MASKNCLHTTKHKWSTEEMKALVSGIRDYGASNTNKLAEVVKTKSADEIRSFLNKKKASIKAELRDAGTELEKEDESCEGHSTPRRIKQQSDILETSKSWAPIEFWTYLSKKFIDPKYRADNHSKVFQKLFRDIADASDLEPMFAGEPNFRELYNYFAALLSGSVVPPQLTPTNCALVTRILDDLAAVCNAGDWQEEVAFCRSILRPAKFICSESAASSENAPEASLHSSVSRRLVEEPGCAPQNEILLPKELYDSVCHNKSIQECLNPLCVPRELLQKEQEALKTILSNLRK